MTTPQQQLNNKAVFISGAVAVTNNVKAIIRQGDITVPQLPNLPSYQQEARQDCQMWINEVWPMIKNTAEDIIYYAKTFQDIYQQLLDVLKQGQDAKPLMEDVLQNLLSDLDKCKSESDCVTASVKSFCSKYQSVYNKFQQAYEQASNDITQSNTTLTDLVADRAKLKTQAHEYYLKSLIPFAGAYYAIKYAETEDKIHSVSCHILSLSADLSSIETAHDQLADLQNYGSKIISFSQDVTDGWQSLADNMSDLIKHVQSVSSDEVAIVIKIQLAAANKEWQNVLSQAGKLQ